MLRVLTKPSTYIDFNFMYLYNIHCEKFCTSLVKLSKKVRPIGFLLENFYLPLVKLSWICRLKELLTVSNFQYLN